MNGFHRAPPVSRPPARWVPPGEDIWIGPFLIRGGMVYVDHPGPGMPGPPDIPEAIDLSLPISYQPAAFRWPTPPRPTYRELTPGQRGTYLSWLTGGRWARDTPIGYVFLYSRGLERRALADTADEVPDLREITAEVTRLVGIYGVHQAFHTYATALYQRLSTRVAVRTRTGNVAAEAVTSTRTPSPTRSEVHTHRLVGDGTVGAPPTGLVDHDDPRASTIHALITRHLAGDRGPVVIDGADLTSLAGNGDTRSLSRPDSVTVAQVLERFGVGVEPDVRLGGPPLGPGPTVLFRARHLQPSAAGSAYLGGATLLHLSCLVAVADGELATTERERLADQVGSLPGLTDGERERLSVHVEWLLAGNHDLDGITRRLSQLTEDERTLIGEFLTATAVADGEIHPAEIIALRQIYHLLGLDPVSVLDGLGPHFAGAAAGTARTPPGTGDTAHDIPTAVAEPATATPADADRVPTQPTPEAGAGVLPDTGTPDVMPPVAPSAGATAVTLMSVSTVAAVRDEDPGPVPAGGLLLDQRVIAEKQANASRVSALLGALFAEDDEPPPPRVSDASPTGAITGLDAVHSDLARRLAVGDVWARAGLASLCEELGLMVDGALDTVNEAAIDTCGEPLIDEYDDEFRVNHEARKELLV